MQYKARTPGTTFLKSPAALPLAVLGGFLLMLWYLSSTKRRILSLIEEQNDVLKAQIEVLNVMKAEHDAMSSNVQSLSARLDAMQKGVHGLGFLGLNRREHPAATAATTIIATQPAQPIDASFQANTEIAMFQLERKLFSLEGAVRSVNPARINLRRAKAVVVTGANSGYFGGLSNLVGSIHFWDKTRQIIIFNLGLDPDQVSQISRWDRVLLLDSPVKGNLKTYVWKPTCIRIATELYGKTIWIDAGSDTRGPLDRIDELLEKEDMFFVQGQDENMAPWSYPKTLTFFGTTKSEVTGKYSFSGNLQGHVFDSRAYWEVLKVVERCALISECMTPAGSSLGNHRYDQIAMSGAIYTNPTLVVIPHTELLAAGRDQLDAYHTTPSSHLVWTARASSSEYLRYLGTNKEPFTAPKTEDLLKK